MEKFSNTLELKTIAEGQTVIFKTVVVIKKIERRNAKNGSEFLKIEVGDKFSSFGFTNFSNTSTFNFFQASTPGHIIFMEGMSRHYQGTFSPDILSARRLSEREIQEGNWYIQLEQTTAESLQDLKTEFYGHVESIQNSQLKRTVYAVLEELGDKFFTSVAAKSMHHAYKSGLLEHTVHVTRAGAALLNFYTDIPRDLALAGMLLHDVGKVEEYEGDLALVVRNWAICRGISFSVTALFAVRGLEVNSIPIYSSVWSTSFSVIRGNWSLVRPFCRRRRRRFLFL
jgi:3'-5' exoribonuclease